MSPATCGIAATASASSSEPQPPRLGREVEGDDRPAVGDELGDDPRADAPVRAGDEEARVAHAGVSTIFANSAGRSTRFANASAPSASGAVESQSSGRSPSARTSSARANSARV